MDVTMTDTGASPQAGAPDKPKRKKRKGMVSTALLVVILLAGVACLAYPTVSNWWNSFHQSRAIASYVEAVEDMGEEERVAMLADAQAYNATLVGDSGRYTMTEEEEAEYNSLLDTSGTGIMAYIELPTIGEKMPIHHGVSEGVLQIAAGHLPGSSLPVGGTGTHCVLSGHRGLTSARLFTDIDQLVEGDLFYIHVLGETHAYEVDQIRVVLPDEMDDLEIDPDQDYVTLVTCTPYGVNSHRLLVRGHRVEVPDDFVEMAHTIKWGVAEMATAAGAVALLVLLVVWLVRRKKKQRA